MFDTAAREFNKHEKDRAPSDPIHIPLVTMSEFVRVLEFRRSELERVRESHGRLGSSRDGEWKWPEAWGDIHFSSGVGPGHIRNRDPREDHERLDRALRRYWALAKDSSDGEDGLEQRIERLSEAVRHVEVQDAQGRARVLGLSNSLAEECARVKASCQTKQFVLSEVGDERVYGSVGVGPEGLYIAYRSTSEDLDDGLNNIAQPWSYSVMEPAKWPVEWLRVVFTERKLEEIVEVLLERFGD